MNLAEMIAGMAQAQESDEDRLTHEQQVIRLREIAALRAEKHAFQPGQIILHKHPESAMIKGAKEPHMFIRYLEKPIVCSELATLNDIATASATIVFDCVGASLWCDGVMATFFLDSASFKPHPDFPVEG